ncbi:MAG: DNA alkylation repair protein [Verrucomicrobiaceae bacterium]|nr:DNA alkylation repair protein [Verrucomicrobiaceae bacterium]
MNLAALRAELRLRAKPEHAAVALRFFKTGPGQYGEGDEFLGLKVPQIRALVRSCDGLVEADVLALLHSALHEERLLALFCLVRRFERGDQKTRASIFSVYLKNTRWINNWDLVDTSAPHIVGAWLLDKDRSVLRRLAKSRSLWERRIAVLATQTFIRGGQFDDTVEIVRSLLGDTHDLMHKACGWMLREVGNRDVKTLEGFLAAHVAQMPRTMLRYAIEKLPEKRRKAWLAARS